jgi:hypothetical protein
MAEEKEGKSDTNPVFMKCGIARYRFSVFLWLLPKLLPLMPVVSLGLFDQAKAFVIMFPIVFA